MHGMATGEIPQLCHNVMDEACGVWAKNFKNNPKL